MHAAGDQNKHGRGRKHLHEGDKFLNVLRYLLKAVDGKNIGLLGVNPPYESEERDLGGILKFAFVADSESKNRFFGAGSDRSLDYVDSEDFHWLPHQAFSYALCLGFSSGIGFAGNHIANLLGRLDNIVFFRKIRRYV